MLSKENWAQTQWIRWEGPKTPYATPRPGDSANERVHVLDLFVTVKLLGETPVILLLHKLCSKRGYSYEWKNGETLRLTKNGKTLTCTMDNSVLLVVSRLSSYSSSISLSSTSRSMDQSNYSRKIGNTIRASVDSKWQACTWKIDADRSSQSGHGEPWTSKRDERGRSNARHSCLVTALHS